MTIRIPIPAAVLLAALVVPTLAAAQASRPPVEVAVTYGSMWGGHIKTYDGKARTGTGGAIGVSVDVPIRRGLWIEAGYTSQDGSLDWDPRAGSKRTLTDMSVNFWHIGTVRSLVHPSAPVIPYGAISIGATHFSPNAGSVVIDGSTYELDSFTKFSVAFGVGFKAYLGQAQRFGIRGQFKAISTLFDTAGGVWFGPGGIDLGVSGSGIWQFEASGGITVRFGS